MPAPKVDAVYIQDLKRARALVQDLLKDEASFDGFVRLGIHDAFAYDDKKKVYGANASIRTQKELSHVGNEGLAETVASLANVKSAVPNITFADLYQLAGITAIASAGGPDIPFTAGRKDGWSFPPQGAYLSPNTGENSLEHFKQWNARIGLSVKHAVALLGAHSVARWWADKEGEATSGSSVTFSNDYFSKLLGNSITQDSWLLQDSDIKGYVDLYAQDSSAFFRDYADAHAKLSLLGTNLEPKPIDLGAHEAEPEYVITATEYAIYAAGAVAASGAVAFGVWKWRRRYLRTGRLFG